MITDAEANGGTSWFSAKEKFRERSGGRDRRSDRKEKDMKTAGIDIGTTTISLVLIDGESGQMVGKKTIEHGSGSFLKGEFETSRIQDPGRICSLALSGFEELTKDCDDVKAIGMTGQMHGMLYVDRNGMAVSPLYTWQDGSGDLLLPEENISMASFLRENVGNAAAGYGVTTHAYLQRTGRIPGEAVSMVTISDYLAMRMCGNTAPFISTDMAASWGCFDLEGKSFQKDRLHEAGVDVTFLPQVHALHDVVGQTKDGIPVICSLGDNQASVIGSVRDISSTLLLNVGTGSQVSMGTEKYIPCSGSVELRPCTEDLYLLSGSSLCGGRAYAMLEQFFRSAPGCDSEEALYDCMLAQAEEFLARHDREEVWKIRPVFSGTRSNPEESGSISGIRTTNFTPGAMTAGMILGILEELDGYYSQMKKLTEKKASVLVGSGNGIRRNPLMRRLAEELFGMPMRIPAFCEEAAFGAALAALHSAGYTATLQEAQKMISYE